MRFRRCRAPLKLAGRPWGKVRFWLMPRPGFELRDRRRVGEVEAGLLKGGPAADPVQELLEPAVYALYTENGMPSLSPWDETPRLSDRLRPSSGEGSATVAAQGRLGRPILRGIGAPHADARARRGERFRHAEPDAAVASGDQGHLPAQVEAGICHRPPFGPKPYRGPVVCRTMRGESWRR